jgi:phosphoribosylformylglycinamidine synthase
MMNSEVYRELGLSDEEYQKILDLLGREPTPTELAMFSVEWSEHCGYPRSRRKLSLLPREGKAKAIVGGDCGGIEIAPGLAVLFKVESHNHPSQVEPKQGAATGVGGILRDIFTTGARPIALLNSLRFGELSDPHARYLFRGVVDGIQFYGNCIGVPTVGGEVMFHNSYRGNCLVNVMCIGLADMDKLVEARAAGPGNSVMYLGASTGRDGIGGCSVLASHELSQELAKRPSVQIGDPFAEKCLLEACLEAIASGAIVAMKDMGAAGLTCTSSEMAAEGGVGMELDLSLVPRREAGMEPWELMMSESQERMLAVVGKGREKEVEDIFRKWGLNAVVLGRVTHDGLLRLTDGGRPAAEVKAAHLAGAPSYVMEEAEPSWLKEAQAFDAATLPAPKDIGEALLQLLSSPNIASKRWVYEQYDHMVQTNTVVLPASDAAVLRIKGVGAMATAMAAEGLAIHELPLPGIAAAMDGSGRYCSVDPHLGAQIAVAEAARNLACSGAEPVAITDCLNFGNPEKPDRFWQFARCVEGIADACRALRLAVVSGNVSFYNEGPEGPIAPTPIIGAVGLLKDVRRHCSAGFKRTGDLIILLGRTLPELGASEYLKVLHGLEKGRPPQLDLKLEAAVQACCREAISNGWVSSAHDCSDGGLGVALAESCILGSIGGSVELPEGLQAHEWLFSESQSRIVLSVPPGNLNRILALAEKHEVEARILGEVGGDMFRVRFDGKEIASLNVRDMAKVYREAIESIIE